MDAIDRRIINELHGGFPLSARPYAAVAARLGLDEDALIERLEALLDARVLSRFGPLFVAEIVNGFPEVAHNYARSHPLNMWFVVATEQPERIVAVLREIEAATGLPVLDLPKEEEFFLELRLPA